MGLVLDIRCKIAERIVIYPAVNVDNSAGEGYLAAHGNGTVGTQRD